MSHLFVNQMAEFVANRSSYLVHQWDFGLGLVYQLGLLNINVGFNQGI